ncbi:hypothetical protein EV385_1544 [Krasilnikovia cinnamomea]|uniref:Uncharacterized protein n=1 Tax=Krasilnikovia cinnamomea TaxID=349313 RepID=A0A4Q7ZI61_9ACTN|nr:hypothetical protein EV385_1544 [Krasilnikovia cinnamomea]
MNPGAPGIKRVHRAAWHPKKNARRHGVEARCCDMRL